MPRPLLFALPALLAGASAQAGADTTYGLVVRAYCHDAPATLCGFADEDQMRAYYLREVQVINEVWQPTGVSFRLHDVIAVRDETYASLWTTPGDIDDPATQRGLKVKQLHQIADDDKDHVTMFLLPGLPLCWSVVAPGQFPDYPEVFWGFFCARWGAGMTMAHELGHHFCLPHPFTYEDTADQPGATWDGDGLADTPPDPSSKETNASEDGADVNASGQTLDGHQWCAVDQTIPTDSGSLNSARCTIDCFEQSGGVTLDSSLAPDSSLLMSYWGGCQAPFVVNGHMTEGFSADELARVRSCIDTVPSRQSYVDLCATRGADADHDGWCDADDACPYERNADNTTDSDGDGVPDDCDRCPDVQDPGQLDTDGDGVGDACDDDDDNDGCDDVVDQHPTDALQPAGYELHPGCDVGQTTVWAFEGVDSDDDGLLDCEDDNDDGDAFDDVEDPCRVTPGEDGGTCSQLVEVCVPTYYEAERFDFGPDQRLWLVSRIDPADELPFDRASLVGDTLFLGRLPGMTAGRTLRALQGEVFGLGGLLDAQLALEAEVVAGRAAGAPLRRELLRFNPRTVTAAQVQDGLAVQFRLERMGASAGTSWGVGLGPRDLAADADGDGVPDPADLCTTVPDPRRGDLDGDGFGDACDADLDQDGLVDGDDVRAVRGCDGVDVNVLQRLGAVDEPVREGIVSDPEAIVRARECRGADLDLDGDVDADDLTLVLARRGTPPGPSGAVTAPDVEPQDTGVVDTDTDVDTDGPEPDEGGCGCVQGAGSPVPWVGLLALGVVRRRRRRI